MALPPLTGCARPKTPSGGTQTVVDELDVNEMCALRFTQSTHCLTWHWNIQPGYQRSGTMVVKMGRANLYDQTVIPQDADLPLSLDVDMPDMHHGTPRAPKIERLDTGTYKISNIWLSMQGRWEIRLQQRDGERLVDEAIVPYDFNF